MIPRRDVDAWVFDLDNTLYPTGATIYDHIGARMTDYIARIADVDADTALDLREAYFERYGATLSGLMKHHGVDGRDFLDYVHDVDLSVVDPDPELADLIARLEGPRLVFTNGARAYAERITARLGLGGLFHDLFDIEAAGFVPKPQRGAFDALIARHRIDPARTVLFEDSARNLETAHTLGFRTVLIDPEWTADQTLEEHIHHASDCLKAFLRSL
ncbi:MAG: pyrimidine 5'-nucleotidase [Alphaproteobacteria bacterium]|nr:pyrimidine 5'-nucleotidase [Alphaproteobacteria bacterium]